ncbi:hypothetical protein B0H17DRAFT_215670 [Mycena rosella]|uniref:C3H1-type domain-containing protein n=1 Tax=Mycena rosella TaxID=1033263 RepID=A0AAD7DWT1_MYCRO|nr:hypothetical protein B0H17DRAFT_215670 [Mycena rosella]
MFRNKKPCIFFQEGRCRYGTKCSFSHGVATTSAPSSALPYFNPEPARGSSPATNNHYSNWATSPPPSRARDYEASAMTGGGRPDAPGTLVEVLNSMRVSAGQAERTIFSKFCKRLFQWWTRKIWSWPSTRFEISCPPTGALNAARTMALTVDRCAGTRARTTDSAIST